MIKAGQIVRAKKVTIMGEKSDVTVTLKVPALMVVLGLAVRRPNQEEVMRLCGMAGMMSLDDLDECFGEGSADKAIQFIIKKYPCEKKEKPTKLEVVEKPAIEVVKG